MDHPIREFIPLGSANQDGGAPRGSGVVHLRARRLSCSISTHQCILRYLLIFKSELLESGDRFHISNLSSLSSPCHPYNRKAQKAQEKEDKPEVLSFQRGFFLAGLCLFGVMLQDFCIYFHQKRAIPALQYL